jgi:CAAX protease family protein
MIDRRETWKTIGLFLALATAFSAVFEGLLVAIGELGAGFGLYVTALMWCPAAAAFVTAWVRRVPLAELGWRWPARRWILIGWLLPLGYCVVAYGVTWASGLGSFPDAGKLAKIAAGMHTTALPRPLQLAWYVALAGTVGVIRSAATALGEEIGWRGLLVPQLAKVVTRTTVAWISGGVWVLYHVAILVGADYNSGTPAWWGLSCFTIMILGSGAIMVWLRLESASVWPCVLLHASHNLFVQDVFTPLTGDTGHTAWVIDEFGAALAIAIGLAGLAALRHLRRGPR